MGLQGYVGNAEDARRIQRQQKQREDEKRKFEEAKSQKDANVDAAGFRKFNAGASEALEASFKVDTVGLVTREEFLSKRKTLQDRLEAEKRARAAGELEAQQEKAENMRKKARLAAKSKLSFAEDEPEDEEEPLDAPGSDPDGAAGPRTGPLLPAKMGKDPHVETGYLPDKDREAHEAQLREQLKQEYELRQALVKGEPLKVVYSYWTGTGHRRVTVAKKGDTVGVFLAKVREQLAPEFRDLRNTSVTSLMYVKEDLIIPHGVSFYDLIQKRARGKSGPLFHFDVHEDIRAQQDASVEKDESHAGKVVDRHWYGRNKHIFPASRWELYDPDKAGEPDKGYSIWG